MAPLPNAAILSLSAIPNFDIIAEAGAEVKIGLGQL
jgi:hypothetical protein